VIEGIQKRIPGTPIVMHGSSSVPKEEVRRINAAGGKLDPSARGVNEEEYLPAAKLGVTKINIDTDGRLVWTRVHREFFRDKPAEFDLRPPGTTFIDEYAKFIAHKSKKLGSAGQLPVVRAALTDGLRETQIKAYYLWEEAGRPAGRDVELWLTAEDQKRHTSDLHSAQG
jgi:fructose-bisphosphate aldolase class II